MGKFCSPFIFIALLLLTSALGAWAATGATTVPTPVKVFGVTLTTAQAEKFKAICNAEQPAEQAIRDNAALSEADKKTQITAIYAKIKLQLIAILTPEQIAQMKQTPTAPMPTPVTVFGVTLTPEQAKHFKAICDAAQPAKQAISNNTTLSAEQKRSQIAAVYAKIKQQLIAILTPAQIAQMTQTPAATPTPPAPVKVFGVTLTPEQAKQFKAINDAAQPEKKAIMDSTTLSADEKRTQMTAIYAKIKQQLIAILTPAQVAEMSKQ